MNIIVQMGTKFLDSEALKTYRGILHFDDKRNLKRRDEYLALSNLSLYSG